MFSGPSKWKLKSGGLDMTLVGVWHGKAGATAMYFGVKSLLHSVEERRHSVYCLREGPTNHGMVRRNGDDERGFWVGGCTNATS